MTKVLQFSRRTGIASILLLAWLGVFPLAAEEISEVQVKAAFLYNFAKFVEWPTDAFAAPNSPLVIGVAGDDSFARALEKTVAGKTIGGRAMQVRKVEASDFKFCHILFVPTNSSLSVSTILARVAGADVLTVGDSEHFAESGGVINFFIEDARVRFAINPAAAQRAHLKVSSQLLVLARLIR